ncbi:MAG TPA: hypothetical protein VK171_09815 [Fimbriimonas sp.]|nr:hypothetical protein [Fimbriimonas sp.]
MSNEPQQPTAADRWLMREGWHFLRWTVNREMVKWHDKVGYSLLGASPIAASLLGFFLEPKAAIIGLGFLTAGAVHLGLTKWIRRNDMSRDNWAPKLTPQAHRFLSKIVKETIGTDPFGQKYYNKLVRQSADQLKQNSANFMNPVAAEAMEKLCDAYNRLVGTTKLSESSAKKMLEAAEKSMANGLDLIAHLDAFPETSENVTPKIDAICHSLDAVSAEIETTSELKIENLAAWREVLETSSNQTETL